MVNLCHSGCLASRYPSMLSSRSFVILKLIFRSMVQLNLIFVYNTRWESRFFSFAYRCPIEDRLFIWEERQISGRRVLPATVETKLKGKMFPLAILRLLKTLTLEEDKPRHRSVQDYLRWPWSAETRAPPPCQAGVSPGASRLCLISFGSCPSQGLPPPSNSMNYPLLLI